MKSEGKVKHKLKQVKFRTIKKEIRKARSKKPCNCTHSGEVKGQASEKMFYVCLLEANKPKQWEGMICDPSVPNTCPFFEPHKSEQEIENDVERILKSGDMVEIAANFPDLAALLWVLSEDTNDGEE